MMDIKAVAFDLDGTLVDSIKDLAFSANEVRKALGLPALSESRVESFVGDGAASLIARVLADDKSAEPDDSVLQRQGNTLFKEIYRTHLSRHTLPYAGVAETLAALRRQGLKLACVTNKPLHFTEPLLDVLALDPYFELIIGGDTLPEKKPHPMPLLYTAEVLGVSPHTLLMVGDSENDVKSARAAGCPVWVVDYGYAENAAALGADRVISTCDALVELLPE
ncbi:phosphoglycolate phosphatase [Leeia oryzae]|uniref:phosphoglycolate phosphatase n=1 Tax=Leeia oryzae TaxID=356662 RepID=UPI000376092B|nr:phosphoglycolate phosphatase [Leeia oryzae]